MSDAACDVVERVTFFIGLIVYKRAQTAKVQLFFEGQLCYNFVNIDRQNNLMIISFVLLFGFFFGGGGGDF